MDASLTLYLWSVTMGGGSFITRNSDLMTRNCDFITQNSDFYHFLLLLFCLSQWQEWASIHFNTKSKGEKIVMHKFDIKE